MKTLIVGNIPGSDVPDENKYFATVEIRFYAHGSSLSDEELERLEDPFWNAMDQIETFIRDELDILEDFQVTIEDH